MQAITAAREEQLRLYGRAAPSQQAQTATAAAPSRGDNNPTLVQGCKPGSAGLPDGYATLESPPAQGTGPAGKAGPSAARPFITTNEEPEWRAEEAASFLPSATKCLSPPPPANPGPEHSGPPTPPAFNPVSVASKLVPGPAVERAVAAAAAAMTQEQAAQFEEDFSPAV